MTHSDPVYSALTAARESMMDSVREGPTIQAYRTVSSYMKEASLEVRTTSSTGGQKGVKPEAHSLVPVEALAEVARVYNAGAQKYSAHNWRKGYEWSKSYDAAQRHMQAFWGGEDFDPETGTKHLGNAIFHLMGLIVFMDEHPEFDDRYKPEAPDDSTE